jgi:glycine/D-amino acid oxidase-like deaminating enzyme
MPEETDILICGAGIAGVSAAYHLAVHHGRRDVWLVDERPPLSLTSDKSTECYRNWWPGPGDAMVAFMNRSIDLLEALSIETGNFFHLNRRGYLYVTSRAEKIPDFIRAAEEPPRLGAGPLRIHPGSGWDYQPADAERFLDQPDGADLLLDSNLIRTQFPFLSERVVAALHVRRAGWFSAQQLGAHLLDKARQHGVRLVDARVTGVNVSKGRVQSVELDGITVVATRSFVNAAGPLLPEVGKMLGLDLPVYSELHLKVAFVDNLGIVPRHAPLLIWTDPQALSWSADEREMLAEDEASRWLLEEMPPGVHTRPEGASTSRIILILWEYHLDEIEPVWPLPLDPLYPEVALRGLSTMIPALRAYFDKASRPNLDGGYYTKTRENRPLVGPLPVEGAYLIGALSGYGQMASMAAGELLAAHLTGSTLPDYAPAFDLSRYQDPGYLKLLGKWGDSGQL